MKKYVATGVMCKCNFSTITLPVSGSSKLKVNGLKLINKTDTPKGSFGVCNLIPSQPTPCVIDIIKKWSESDNKITGNPILEGANCMCSKGGKIELLGVNPNKKVSQL